MFSSVPVDLGDTVAVKGTPSEFGGQTQVSARGDAEVCADGTAADLPAPARWTCRPTTPTREALEGMRVAPVDTLTVSEVFDLTSFGELTPLRGRPAGAAHGAGPPQHPEAAAIAADNTLRRIVLDDGVSAGSATDPSVPVADHPGARR